MGGFIFLLFATIFGGIFLLASFTQFFVIVQQQQVAVLQFLGKFSRTCGPGFHLKIPYLEQVAGKVSLRIEQLDTDVETKTKDNVFVRMRVSVQYYVEANRVYDAFYRLDNPQRQISSFVFDSVRAQVPQLTVDSVFERKDDIAVQLKKDLDEVMSGFGFTIYKALVTDIDPDAKVKTAMNEINAQQRLKLASVEKAEAAKIEVVKAAEADAESKKLQGIGIAEQRKAIIEGLGESVEQFRTEIDDVNANDVMLLVLMTQYFDTMKDVAENSTTNTLFVPNSASATGDLLDQMRDAFIQAKEAVKNTGAKARKQAKPEK
jgi:regulator of protease activity HflC (stomatin/prohibitin superfamily)